MESLGKRHISPRIVLILAIGLIAVGLAAWLTSIRVQFAIFACLLLAILLLLMTVAQSLWILADQTDLLPLLLTVAKNSELLELFRCFGQSLREISVTLDPICRELAVARATQLERELLQVSQGRFIFIGTETWRMPYERLLRSPGLYCYRSIAHLKTANYWQDEPGRQSMQVNFELADDGRLNIERIAIVPDHLWPPQERFPVDPVRSWLQTQHQHGIIVKLVRQSSLAEEPDLVTDMGLYGNRAVGQQEIDERGRTVQFTLTFDFPEVLAAEQRWERLSIYAISYAQLLDRSTTVA